MPIKKSNSVFKAKEKVLAPKKMENKIKAEVATKKSKILVVEDDLSIASMYRVAFESAGFIFLTTDNGEEAIRLAENEKPDAILLDIILPQWDGFTILTNLKKNDKTKVIPTMMLTNLSQKSDKEKGLALGAIDYFPKSQFTPAQILIKVKEIIKK